MEKGNQTIQNTQNGKYITLNQAGNYTYTVYQKMDVVTVGSLQYYLTQKQYIVTQSQNLV